MISGKPTGRTPLLQTPLLPVAEIQKQMETALHYEGTEEEKKARLFLATLGIDYDKLTPGGICHADPYSQKVRTPEKPQ